VDVAIKFMYEDLPSEVIERARREASIQIEHENLVKMMGFVETEVRNALGESKIRYHVVSELLDGIMLDDFLQGKISNGNMDLSFVQQLYSDYQADPYQFAAWVVKCILSGIMALHDKGYIHRDIDPTNIMITKNGKIKLIDFGIAKHLSSLNAQDKVRTTAGVFIGKAPYAAPELVLGDVTHQNRTTDIYAIGILFFQLITGSLPFEGATHIVLNAQLKEEINLKPIKGKKVKEIIKKATEKNQTERFQSAAEFRVAIEQWELIGNGTNQGRSILKNIKYFAIAASIIVVGIVLAQFDWGSINFDSGEKKTTKIVEVPVPEPEPELVPVQVREVIPPIDFYQETVKMLMNKESAKEGFEKLKKLSDETNPDPRAVCLLSRLYYTGEDCLNDDSVKRMQYNLINIVEPNLVRAHELKKLAVNLDSSNYKALYELASDYFGGLKRTGIESSISRDMKKAEDLFCKGVVIARQKNDSFYEQKFNEQIKRIRKKK